MVAPFLYFMLNHWHMAALITFFIAGISDALDGYLARRFRCQSKFGAFADPLADKLLIVSTYVVLAYHHDLPLWFVGLMVSRDIIIMAGAGAWYSLFGHIEFQPTWISKINTILQLVLIVTVLFELTFNNLSPYLITGIMWLTAITTGISFIDYVVRWSIKAIRRSRQIT